MFLDDLKNILDYEFDSGNNTINKIKGKNCYRLRYSGYKSHKIIDWLYRDAGVYLDRKYEKYLGMRTQFSI